jgi:hypothetical protein
VRQILSSRKTRSISIYLTTDSLLTHYLPLYFPEAERFQGNSRSDWFLALLEQFPTPAGITALSKEAFIEAAWGLVGRKVSKARLLADIYETARSSTALPVRPDSPAIAMFRMVLAEGRSLLRQRDQIEAQAEALLVDDPDSERLRQLRGIGPIIALTILAEAGNLRRPRSPPRWRASHMRSSDPEPTTGRSSNSRCQVEGLRSVSAVRARVTPLPCRQRLGLSLGRVSRFKDGQDRRVSTDPQFAMVENAPLNGGSHLVLVPVIISDRLMPAQPDLLPDRYLLTDNLGRCRSAPRES